MNSLSPILDELSKPFHPEKITWKPGTVKKDQTAALGLAYGDLRAYQNRLDEVLGMEWSVTYTPWGDKLVCHLTIQGITRSSTGEPDSQSERSEIGGTSAEAQAFKRACAMFGLGRYLYEFPSVWADYDANTKKFTEKAQAKLDGIVAQHYKREMAKYGDKKEIAGFMAVLPASVTATEVKEEPAAQAAAKPDSGVPVVPEALQKARKLFNALGTELYGTTWGEICCKNTERITNGASSASDDLTLEQVERLIKGMRTVQEKRISKALNGAMASESLAA